MVSYWWLIAVVVVVLLGAFIWFLTSLVGTLKIDRSDPKKDVYRLDINYDLNKLNKKKFIILHIDDCDLSQE